MAEAFTQKRLAKLFGTQGKRLVIHDPKTVGLRAELREGGTITFYLFRRMPGGSPIRYRIGTFPEVTVEAARTEAQERLGDMAKGIDPAESRRAARGEATIDDLWKAWREQDAMLHKRESSQAEDERQYNAALAPLHKRRLSSLTTADVATWHRRLGESNGRFAANRALALLCTMFNAAPLVLGWKGTNPTKGVKRFAEPSRERFLQPAEFPAFFQAIDAEPDPWPHYFRLAVWTGARRANLQAMAWQDIDLKAATWTIPGEQMKAGKTVVLPLSIEAIEVLKERKASNGNCPWVFPGVGKTGHIKEIKTAWKRIVTAAGLSGLRPHDLRRTLGSWQAGAGVSQAIIGAALGHKPGSAATAIYARLAIDPVRVAVSAATAAMAKAAKPEKPKRTRKPKAK